MTFHDDFEHSMEQKAFEAAKSLKLWLDTIAPVNSHFSKNLSGDLQTLAELMKWPLFFDKDSGIIIIGRPDDGSACTG